LKLPDPYSAAFDVSSIAPISSGVAATDSICSPRSPW
jgi:hypothetical protein